ncbi:hypothetical protein V8C86DRAFT_2798924 [Haematococcus lacustris]
MSTRSRLAAEALSCGFAAGAVGGLMRWLLCGLLDYVRRSQGIQGGCSLITERVGNMTLPAVYAAVTTGGLWGVALLVKPCSLRGFWPQVAVYGLVPTVGQLITMHPYDIIGSCQALPLLLWILNVTSWAVPALWWFMFLGHSEHEEADHRHTPSGRLRNPLLV